ncbi:MAG: MBL fold metallo-hydrolase [Deltaproteobacteria bacterium]|nr:MAG: MBL fold metallo-hydrolase [Deltaproteobacteria bacterium]
MITNRETNTSISEIADGIYRISTPVPPNPALPAGFTFNQFLIDDDEPLLFHTGLRKMFGLVREAVEAVMPIAKLRYVGLSHFEADECGSLNEMLAAAEHAAPVCSMIEKMVSVDDVADREARGLADGERLKLGRHTVRWIDAPQLPHGWGCGYLFEESTATLFCGDLFTQPGHVHAPVTEGDILEPSEAMRAQMEYFAHSPQTGALLRRLADTSPRTLACMHGASWRGDGARLLGALAERLGAR